ncbi:hypothetical protein KAJ27_14845, partial [bacterium]|nr:hypothetical protein [bacterium]
MTQANKFFTSTFDADLGWICNKYRNYSPEMTYECVSIGDSFTFCDEVNNTETWQYQFHEKSKKRILNMGEGGYGLGQSILKYIKHGAEVPAKFAILGLYREMFRRLESYHTYYYFMQEGYKYIFKPIYYLENDILKHSAP